MASGEAWQRNVWALSLSVFIAFVGFQFFAPFLPLYVRELGVTDPAKISLWSGLLMAVTPAVSGLLAPLFGRLADRFGRKLMLIRSLAGFTVIMLGFLVQWPTLPTLLMFPVLVAMYVRLARREEREALARFGEGYATYAASTPAFVPRRPQPATGGPL